MFNLETLLRKNIRELVPYSSARSQFSKGEGVMLDANENPFSLADLEGLNRYPDPLQRELAAATATLKGIAPEMIFFGNGSDEPIDLLIRAFCNPGRDSILALSPSYGMYRVCAQINDVSIVEILLNEDYSLNVERVLAGVTEATKLIFLCSPNNPTANLLENDGIKQIAAAFSGIVVVDEAYIDFAESESCLDLLTELPNLVVLQTFSKAWGLAGIRLGVCFAAPQIISVLQKIKYPYNLNSATLKYGLRAIAQVQKKNELVRELIALRKQLVSELCKVPVVKKVHPSDANFLLVEVADAKATYEYLLQRGIVVRRRDSEPLCANCLRITVGTKSENESLVEALIEMSKEQRDE